ncbi:MAG: hypothetical protein EBT92_14405 [Planctomycetes bacterium]|nr:hypothetical protein [Planctomycetota bacterium]
MKTKFTLSITEAQDRLASHMVDDLPYSENEIEVEIVPQVVPSDNLPLNKASKIALIKLVRTLSDDLLNNRLKLTTRGEFEPNPGAKYWGLAEAKDYVEKYLMYNTPKN